MRLTQQSRTTKKSEVAYKKSPPATNVSLDLSAFSLENCTIETRYGTALALWDRSGALWNSVQERWPDVRLVAAEPAKTVFQSGKTGYTVELKAARISCLDGEKPLADLSKIAREFFKLTTQCLQIPLYERLGLRLIYFKEFEDREAAAAAFNSLGLIKVPEGAKFGVDAPPVNQHYLVRWESEKKGTTLQCRAETRKTDYDPPIESIRLWAPIHREQNGLVVDVDYYTVAPAEVGQVDMGEWVNHAQHVISRDVRYLFDK